MKRDDRKAMKIFIGSSKEAVKRGVVNKLASWVQETGHEPIPWNKPGLFLPGHYVFERLLEITREVDAAILVFSEDDKLWYREKPVSQPRDNVLIEYGLFASVLGTTNVIVARDGNIKKPSNLAGIIELIIASDSEYQAQLVLNEWMKRPREPTRAATIAEPTGAAADIGFEHVHDHLTDNDLQKRLAGSQHIRVLKTWFPETYELLDGLISAIKKRARVKLLLCKPGSTILEERCKGAHERSCHFWIYHAIEKMHESMTEKNDIEIRLYDSWPGCPVIWLDKSRTRTSNTEILMGFYFRGKSSPSWPWVKVKPGSKLHMILEDQFNELWNLPGNEKLTSKADMDHWIKANEKWQH